MLLFFLWVNCTTYAMFILLHICFNIYLFYFKVKFFENTCEGLFSFNLARRLEKLLTPVKDYKTKGKLLSPTWLTPIWIISRPNQFPPVNHQFYF